MNDFKESLKLEDKTLQELAEIAQIHPMLPTKYSAVQRAELRRFEQELLKGAKVFDDDLIDKQEKDIER